MKRERAKRKIAQVEDLPQDTINHVWSLNRIRRHLNSSQAAIAETKLEQLLKRYDPIKEEAKEREQEGRVKGGKTAGRVRKKKNSSPQLVGESKEKHETETDAIRAKDAGTNRTYLALADKLVEDRPELVIEVEQGKKTLS